MFHNADLSMPEYNTAVVPNVSKSHVKNVIRRDNQPEYTEEIDTYTTTWTTVPYFGDNPPKSTDYQQVEKNGETTWELTDDAKQRGVGASGGASTKVSGSKQANKNILSYGENKDKESAADKAKREKDLEKDK
jgi:hypothetical protein